MWRSSARGDARIFFFAEKQAFFLPFHPNNPPVRKNSILPRRLLFFPPILSVQLSRWRIRILAGVGESEQRGEHKVIVANNEFKDKNDQSVDDPSDQSEVFVTSLKKKKVVSPVRAAKPKGKSPS